jgi:hypothetical protein
MKCRCGSKLFYINIIPCCDDCSENGAYFYDEECGNDRYVYDEKFIDDNDLVRDQVYQEGECRIDTAFGAGCYMFICKECNHRNNLAVMEGC